MSYKVNLLDGICARFNEVRWHDSKLISFQLLPKNDNQTHDIGLDLKLLTNAQHGNCDWEDGRLEIEECRVIQLNLDMLGIQLCGGDIANAFCEKASAMKEGLEDTQIQHFDLPQGDDPFADIIHFRILLIHPGGEINIFAKNFKLIVEETSEHDKTHN